MQGLTAKLRTPLQASLMSTQLKWVPGVPAIKVDAEVGQLYKCPNQPQLLVVEEVVQEEVLEVDW